MELISAEHGLMRQEGQFELDALGPDHFHPNNEDKKSGSGAIK